MSEVRTDITSQVSSTIERENDDHGYGKIFKIGSDIDQKNDYNDENSKKNESRKKRKHFDANLLNLEKSNNSDNNRNYSNAGTEFKFTTCTTIWYEKIWIISLKEKFGIELFSFLFLCPRE